MAEPGEGVDGEANLPTADYPTGWEADVVLRDGGTCHLRPIRSDDAAGLIAFHSRLSATTVYYRFFAPYPRLSDRDVERFTHVDYRDRGALVATIGDAIIGVVRYDRVADGEAEVAFVIEDEHQGRGLGTIFLEHIAQAARERGIRRFVAEVLPENARMLEVFEHAGYTAETARDEGFISLSFDITPTTSSLAVTHAREQRAEANAVARLVRPRSVAVVGASRDPGSIGHAIARHVVDGEIRWASRRGQSERGGRGGWAALLPHPSGCPRAYRPSHRCHPGVDRGRNRPGRRQPLASTAWWWSRQGSGRAARRVGWRSSR